MKKLFLILSLFLTFTLSTSFSQEPAQVLEKPEFQQNFDISNLEKDDIIEIGRILDSIRTDVLLQTDGKGLPSDPSGWMNFIFIVLFPILNTTITRLMRVVKQVKNLFAETDTLAIVLIIGLMLGLAWEAIDTFLQFKNFSGFNFQDAGGYAALTVCASVLVYEGLIKRVFGKTPKIES